MGGIVENNRAVICTALQVQEFSGKTSYFCMAGRNDLPTETVNPSGMVSGRRKRGFFTG